MSRSCLSSDLTILVCPFDIFEFFVTHHYIFHIFMPSILPPVFLYFFSIIRSLTNNARSLRKVKLFLNRNRIIGLPRKEDEISFPNNHGSSFSPVILCIQFIFCSYCSFFTLFYFIFLLQRSKHRLVHKQLKTVAFY